MTDLYSGSDNTNKDYKYNTLFQNDFPRKFHKLRAKRTCHVIKKNKEVGEGGGRREGREGERERGERDPKSSPSKSNSEFQRQNARLRITI
jgi:hypothetical protein